MAETNVAKIPPYNLMYPALWVNMVEATFLLGVPIPVTESITKYKYVVSHLPPEIASIVRDIILKPRYDDPYLHLKTEFAKRSGESSQEEIRKFLAVDELGDRKHTKLLLMMKHRAKSHNIPNILMLEQFQQHMPSNAQSILVAIMPLEVYKAAKIADRVIEVTLIQANTVSSIPVNSLEDKFMNEIKKLHDRLELTQSRTYNNSGNFNSYRESSNKRSKHVKRKQTNELRW